MTYTSTSLTTVFIPCGQQYVRLDQIEFFEDKNGSIEIGTLSGGIFTYSGTLDRFLATLRNGAEVAS